MAKLSRELLGQLRGSVGDVVFRRVGGKTIVCRKPKSFVPGTDRKSVERRSKFGLAVKFARAIYSVPELKALWQQASPQRKYAFNFILQTNLGAITPNSITEFAAITPPHTDPPAVTGFRVDCTGSTVTTGAIAVELAAIGNAAAGPNAKLAYVLSLTSPTNAASPDVRFVSGTSEPKPFVPGVPLSFNVPMPDQIAASIGSYSEKRLLLALLTLDTPGNPLDCSNTIVR